MHSCQTPFHVRRCVAVVVCVWLGAAAPQVLQRVHVTGRARRPDVVQQPNMASHMRVRSLFVVVVGFAGLCAKVMHACRSAWVVSVRTCKVATHKHAFTRWCKSCICAVCLLVSVDAHGFVLGVLWSAGRERCYTCCCRCCWWLYMRPW
jgi:hypothetical protein